MDVEQLPYEWEQQPGEGSRAYEAFQAYRDAYPNTSTRAVAQAQGKSYATIHAWSTKHRWVERATAWTAEQDRRRREAFIHESVEMAKRQATEASAHARVLMQPAQSIIRQLSGENAAQVRARLDRLPIDDLLRLAIAAARVWPTVMQAERLARGQSTANVEFTRPTDAQGSVASDEERMARVFAAWESAGISPVESNGARPG